MALRVPVTFTSVPEWGRKVAQAVNQLLQGQDALSSGPFADDAAAGAGGIAVGGVYRRPDGSLGWRQA